MADLTRLFAPRSIAVVGGGAWCAAILEAANRIGFDGEIFPVHPAGKIIAGVRSLPSLADYDGPIDAAFVGVNRLATLDVVAQLRDLGAGGAICFASGFSEAVAEDRDAADLQAQLVATAGAMPILGPNCYGFINALDGAAIWPDQHGCRRVPRGVAILTQSSNIAINLTMQRRGLPIGYVVTCGNQAQTSQAAAAMELLQDPRVTAIGLHIEGFGDLRGWEALAKAARLRGVPLIALKTGKSTQAQAAAVSHTASLAGDDAGAAAFMARLGIARMPDLPSFLEALKLAHVFGPLPSHQIASISCSGGEAALAADSVEGLSLCFPPLNDGQRDRLAAALGPMVALANPLDYHTYIWRDEAAMCAAWSAMADPAIALILLIIDYPRADLCDPADWEAATRAAIRAAKETNARFAVVASLPEGMPEEIAERLLAAGVAPLNGLDHALRAIDALAIAPPPPYAPVALPRARAHAQTPAVVLAEADAKAVLAAHGMSVPPGFCAPANEIAEVAKDLTPPFVLKKTGLAHKTEEDGLRLGLGLLDLPAAAQDLGPDPLLVEEMATGAVAELLLGVTLDPAHGFVLTLAAGGVLAEVLADRVHLLLPASDDAIEKALSQLRIAPVLAGYRGAPAAHVPAIVAAIQALSSYVLANATTVKEAEVNPLICTPKGAVAVDALIRKAPAHD